MMVHISSPRRIWSCVSDAGQESQVMRYAQWIARQHRSEVCARMPEDGCVGGPDSAGRWPEGDADMIVTDWVADVRAFTNSLQAAYRRNVPTVFVRDPDHTRIRRIQVATSGGPHTMPLLWVAGAMAKALRVPVRVVRWRPPEDDPTAAFDPYGAEIERWAAVPAGLPAGTRFSTASWMDDSVLPWLEPGDLLVVGAPSAFRLGAGFHDTLPERWVRNSSNPMLMLMAGRPSLSNLRGLLWGRLAHPRLRAESRESVTRKLAQSLHRHHQVSALALDSIIARAMKIPALAPMVEDYETLLMHVEVPGFRGLAGSMAVCPDGVEAGRGCALPARFFILLLTSEGYCEEYLHVLARIAKRMARPDLRDALLSCETPEEIRDVLEPSESAVLEVMT